ncbi:MAG: low molecular weight protein-tyrosine-phosphatase [Bowdeniella nasicola]|nr:low molecular weight protein-tyrosine-phosphatase [Bowdeniella nasicola]
MTTSPSTPRVLVVCTGNICRSAMADVVLHARAAERGLDLAIDSAGVSNEEEGNPIDPRARRVLSEAGYAVPEHRARQVEATELAETTLVLAMTTRHLTALRHLAARAGVGEDNLHMWREYDPDLPEGTPVGSALDVPDPWYGGHTDFVDTLEVVERCADRVLDALTSTN